LIFWSVEDLEDFDVQGFEPVGSSQILLGFFWFVSESLGKFVRVSKITSTIFILIGVIRNVNIMSATKCDLISTMCIYFLFFLDAVEFFVVVQLENKRFPFSCLVNHMLRRLQKRKPRRMPTEIGVSTEGFSVFGFNYINCRAFVVAPLMEVTAFETVSWSFVN
jgi:hypothetical protein